MRFFENIKIFNIKSKTTTAMKNEKLSALLGKEVTDVSALTAEDLAKIEANVAQSGSETQLPAVQGITMEQVTEAVNSAITPLNEKITAQAGLITALTGRVDIIGGKPGAEPTTTPKVKGAEVDYSKTPWLDPNDPINQAINETLGEA